MKLTERQVERIEEELGYVGRDGEVTITVRNGEVSSVGYVCRRPVLEVVASGGGSL